MFSAKNYRAYQVFLTLYFFIYQQIRIWFAKKRRTLFSEQGENSQEILEGKSDKERREKVQEIEKKNCSKT